MSSLLPNVPILEDDAVQLVSFVLILLVKPRRPLFFTW